ncbi:MAG: hypothetical protein ACLQE9_10430, partial [Roseiarcus sp.]
MARHASVCRTGQGRAFARLQRQCARNFPLFSMRENLDFQIFPKLFLAETRKIRGLGVKKFGKRTFLDFTASIAVIALPLRGENRNQATTIRRFQKENVGALSVADDMTDLGSSRSVRWRLALFEGFDGFDAGLVRIRAGAAAHHARRSGLLGWAPRRAGARPPIWVVAVFVGGRESRGKDP